MVQYNNIHTRNKMQWFDTLCNRVYNTKLRCARDCVMQSRRWYEIAVCNTIDDTKLHDTDNKYKTNTTLNINIQDDKQLPIPQFRATNEFTVGQGIAISFVRQFLHWIMQYCVSNKIAVCISERGLVKKKNGTIQQYTHKKQDAMVWYIVQ